jgi:hypothetical protein
VGFRVFFACYGMKKEKEREREHTRKKKDGNSREAV